MKVTIFDVISASVGALSATGSESILPEVSSAVEVYRADFPESEIEVYTVDASRLKDCIGCWSCWVKTPGRCVFADQMTIVYEKLIGSDRVLLMLPVKQGFVEGAAKTFIDRIIPIYHPYIMLHEGEMMHQDRYEKYPDFEFYVDANELDSGQETVLEDYFFRMAHHFRQKGVRLVESNRGLIRKPLDEREPKADLPSEVQLQQKGKYIVYNGSPRGKSGNSLKIANQIVEGIKKAGISEQQIELRHMVDQSAHDTWAQDFHNHNHHFFVFPLYVHSMPGIVKKFFDKLTVSAGEKSDRAQLSFFVQSGFEGAFQSFFLRAYLARFTVKLNCNYGGTLIKSGMEALQMKPDEANKGLYAKLHTLGETYVTEGQISMTARELLESKPFISTAIKTIYKILKTTGITNFYWNMQLKKNGAFDKRFDRPYGK